MAKKYSLVQLALQSKEKRGEVLSTAREKSKLSIEDCAADTSPNSASVSAIKGWENGGSWPNAASIAKYLHHLKKLKILKKRDVKDIT
jgi:DNA-binding transcriptional regulator YiaG